MKSPTLRLEMCLLSGMMVKIKAGSITKSWRMTRLKVMNNLKHPGLLIGTCRFPIGLWSDCYLVEISFIVGTQVSILYRTKRHWTMRSPNAWFLSVTRIFLIPSHLLTFKRGIHETETPLVIRLSTCRFESFVGTAVKCCIEQSRIE